MSIFSWLARWWYRESIYTSHAAPIPGFDAEWEQSCCLCDSITPHVSRNGFKDGSITHCAMCGLESVLQASDDHIARVMIDVSARVWATRRPYPYDWHTKTEAERTTYLAEKP